MARHQLQKLNLLGSIDSIRRRGCWSCICLRCAAWACSVPADLLQEKRPSSHRRLPRHSLCCDAIRLGYDSCGGAEASLGALATVSDPNHACRAGESHAIERAS